MKNQGVGIETLRPHVSHADFFEDTEQAEKTWLLRYDEPADAALLGVDEDRLYREGKREIERLLAR